MSSHPRPPRLRSPSTLAALWLLAVLLPGPACSLRSTEHLSRGVLGDAAAPDLDPSPDLEPEGPGGLDPDVPPTSPEPDAPLGAETGETDVPDAGSIDAASAAGDGGAAAARVLLVIGDPMLSASDAAIQKRLADRGLAVVLVPDTEVATLDVTGARLVFVSPSVLSTRIGASFRDLRKPLIVSEPLVFDETGLVDPAVVNSRGTAARETVLEIIAPGSPVAAGLSGMVTITTEPVTISWGLPPGNSQRLATVAGRPDRIAFFTYEAGAPMVGLTAPARRVGFFLSISTAASLSPQGWALFDAAVAWALGERK